MPGHATSAPADAVPEGLLHRDAPWAALPADVSTALGAVLPQLVEEIIRCIPQEVPEYSRPLEGEFGAGVRRGVETALRRLFVDLPGTDQPGLTAQTRTVYRQLGVGEARAGRSLEALLSAYRVGARITFRAVATAATSAGVDPALMMPLGESIFVYIDQVSAASIEGFTDEQGRQLGERDRRRQSLVARLLAGRVDEVEARRLAARAGWVIPGQLIAIVLPPDRAEGLRLALGDRALVSTHAGQVVALLEAPHSSRARAELEHALVGRRAWLGPARSWELTRESHRAATLAQSLSEGRGDTVGKPRWVDEHIAGIVITSEPDLIADLARRRLEPLQQLRPGQRQRLAETLLAWLRHRGERARIAEELHVHPQTVGYRLTQLREVFGDALDDADTRFDLELVLRAGHRPA
ncbi:PucR family transcriptional regulator [Leekyejoonella antrihumi]|uniref:PucR family transcriptional regulator n=1 Tax=Leekyejoonella antrihumi TaxID=1660198 RepID=A0A563DVJ3_9MICO|nr:helix-turn-helix domain-containing protein [Leekyejoonella antrihumi]TWP34226.1 PucR family transcriptional regulator [Leekyejoonella antrihumi]